MDHNLQRKIALINDYTGFGKCSVAVQLPIISHLGVACSIMPTAILSNHTAYDEYFIEDYTGRMKEYIDQWRKLKLRFEGVCTGFLGSASQIDIVLDFVEEFLTSDGVLIVDPIMADDGKVYDTYTSHMCEGMKKLVSRANIVTPNITEACILTDTDYKLKWSFEELLKIGKALSKMGPEKVVITGICTEHTLGNFVYEEAASKAVIVKEKRYGINRCGTGDVFSAIIAADAMRGVDFEESVRRAATFILKALRRTEELNMDPKDGVAFEDVLCKLK